MTHFLDLPNEIFHLVVENLPRNEVGALSITCKALHALIEPLLYASFNWTWEPKSTYPKTNEWPQMHCSLVLLLRSILERPRLATYIRSVTLCGTEYCEHYLMDDPLPTIPSSMYGNELDQYVSFVRKTGVLYANSWIEDLRQGHVAAFVTLLLAQTHNLTRLHLDPNFTRGREMNSRTLHRDSPAVPSRAYLLGKLFYTALLDSSDHGLPKFTQLEHISMPSVEEHYRDPDQLELANTLIFFYLPGLKSLSARCPNAAPGKFPWPSARPSSPVESLNLSFLREETLGEVLKATKNLKSLRWEWQYDPDLFTEHNNKPAIELDKLAPALKPVRNTLQDLTISAFNCISVGFYESMDLEVTGTLEKLASFNLKRLQIPFPFALGRCSYDDDNFIFGYSEDNDEDFDFDYYHDDGEGFDLDYPHENHEVFDLDHSDEYNEDFFLGHYDDEDEGRLETCIPHTVEELVFTHDLSRQEGFLWESRRILGLFRLWLGREDFKEKWPDLGSIRLKVTSRDHEWVEEKVKDLESLASSVGVRSEVEKYKPWRVHSPPQGPVVDSAVQDDVEERHLTEVEAEARAQVCQDTGWETGDSSEEWGHPIDVIEKWPKGGRWSSG